MGRDHERRPFFLRQPKLDERRIRSREGKQFRGRSRFGGELVAQRGLRRSPSAEKHLHLGAGARQALLLGQEFPTQSSLLGVDGRFAFVQFVEQQTGPGPLANGERVLGSFGRQELTDFEIVDAAFGRKIA